jgi:hypothetical protein
MPNVEESKVFNALLSLRTSGTVSLDGRQISIKIEPVDNHVGDSPDFFLWLEIELIALGQNLRIRVPIPVEAEKGGIYGGAIEDLQKFIERKRHPIELPMLVVAEAGYDDRQERIDLPAVVTMLQIPIRELGA